jgi:hypothetical protein
VPEAYFGWFKGDDKPYTFLIRPFHIDVKEYSPPPPFPRSPAVRIHLPGPALFFYPPIVVTGRDGIGRTAGTIFRSLIP